MNNDELKDDNAPAVPATTDMARTFTFNGIKLHPFSSAREAAYYRLTFDPVSAHESSVLRIFLCLSTSAQCDAARGDGCAAFRTRAFEWADQTLTTNALKLEAARVADEILAHRLASLEIEPDVKGSAPGNA